MARDGGWWVLGVTDPAMADCLRAIPTSRSGYRRRNAGGVADTGLAVTLVPTLADVDTVDDVDVVRRVCAPDSRFCPRSRRRGSACSVISMTAPSTVSAAGCVTTTACRPAAGAQLARRPQRRHAVRQRGRRAL